MKLVFITIACLGLFGNLPAQGITLLYKFNKGWYDPLSWMQINTPAGSTPIQRVPTELDDVIISKALSGIAGVGFSTDTSNADFNIGGNGPYGGSRCRSMHISNTEIYFDHPMMTDGAPIVNIYTSNGGFVIIDSGSNMRHGHFQLHGGNAAITDLQIYNSTFGVLFSHADWSGLGWGPGGRARLINSTLGGYVIGGYSGGNIYADSCTLMTNSFVLGDNSTDTVLNCTIQNDLNNVSFFFFIGRNANFVSSNVNVSPVEGLNITTSGSVLNGNVTTTSGYGGVGFNFIQEDPANPLPNIINGNVSTGDLLSMGISGDLKISGNFSGYSDEFFGYSANVIVNGENIFEIGGITNYKGTASINNCTNDFCHFKLEFFGNTNSNISWNGGFPADTLIINKSGCAKVTSTNSLYVSGATRIEQGQLVLEPNDAIPYKFVCAGDVDIAQGGGVLLRKNGAGVTANMAIGGILTDHNSAADSTCMGLSNPYRGTITFYEHVLPVTLLDFYGIYKDKAIFLGWRTEREINAKYFIVEKSFDQVLFAPITNVTAYGNTQHIKSYQCTDNSSLKRINYYRLKMVDADGRLTYSKTIAIAGSMGTAINIYPNPGKDKLFIRLAGASSETVVAITDAKGNCVRKLLLKAGITEATVNISGLSSGVYSISFQSDEIKNTRQFIKQ